MELEWTAVYDGGNALSYDIERSLDGGARLFSFFRKMSGSIINIEFLT